MARLIFYYQTLRGLAEVLEAGGCGVTHIHVAACHFGLEADGQPYVHLNNEYIDTPGLADTWALLGRARDMGISVRLMLGGAGGGFATLLGPHHVMCRAMLSAVLTRHCDVLDGVDFDVEEAVDLAKLLELAQYLLKTQQRGLQFSFAPLAASLKRDVPGMGGFVYKQVFDSLRFNLDYFCVQCYGSYTPDDLAAMVANGYDSSMIVMGMTASQGVTPADVAAIRKRDPHLGGVYVWECFDAQPDPVTWAQGMRGALGPPEGSAGLALAPPTF